MARIRRGVKVRWTAQSGVVVAVAANRSRPFEFEDTIEEDLLLVVELRQDPLHSWGVVADRSADEPGVVLVDRLHLVVMAHKNRIAVRDHRSAGSDPLVQFVRTAFPPVAEERVEFLEEWLGICQFACRVHLDLSYSLYICSINRLIVFVFLPAVMCVRGFIAGGCRFPTESVRR